MKRFGLFAHCQLYCFCAIDKNVVHSYHGRVTTELFPTRCQTYESEDVCGTRKMYLFVFATWRNFFLCIIISTKLRFTSYYFI